jgi:uncharacterized protein (DUF305 family)
MKSQGVERHPWRWTLLLLLLLAGPVALAGCGGDDDVAVPRGETSPNIVQPGAPGQASRTLSQEELDAIEPPPHTQADVDFMRGMIHHHAQALRMTALVPKRSTSEDVKLLAERIDVSQEGEIEQMTTWLESRGEEAPELHRIHGHAHGAGIVLMPGMLTEEELKELEAAKGAAFDRLFLRFMIRHHEGALTMVQQLYDGGGGLEPDADAFARHVDGDQTIEIVRMRGMLAARG